MSGIQTRSRGRAEIPISEFHRHFNYDPDTGIFTRRFKATSSRPVGAVATHNRQDRLVLKVGKYLFEASHVAWLMSHGEWPPVDKDVDHIDRNPHNNRLGNLRLASRFQNTMNMAKKKNNKSGFKGVTKHPQQNAFWCRISAGGKRYQLGLYPTAELAAGAYRIAAAAMHAEYSGV